jgi:hypothetical protein
MSDKSIKNKLFEQIKADKIGKIHNSNDFSNLYAEKSVSKALERLEKHGKMVRLGRGLYLYPRHDPRLGVIYPSLAEIATELSRKEKLRIIPTGQQALLQLGLSTQVPMKSIYLTDGGPRNIKIGNRVLIFKPTTPKMTALKGKISGPVIQALKTLGKDGVNEDVENKIASLLSTENPILAEADAMLAPAWIRALMMKFIKNK